MRAKLLAVFLVVQVFLLSACVFQHAGPDPEVLHHGGEYVDYVLREIERLRRKAAAVH